MLIQDSKDSVSKRDFCCLKLSSVDLILKPISQLIIFIFILLSLNADHRLFLQVVLNKNVDAFILEAIGECCLEFQPISFLLQNSYYKTKMCFRLAFKKKTKEGQMSGIIQLCQISHCIWLVGTFSSELPVRPGEKMWSRHFLFDIQFQIKSRQEQSDEIRSKGGQIDFPQTTHVIMRKRTSQNFEGVTWL